MPAYKNNEKGTWYVSFYFENWKGKNERKLKRGFKTRRDALQWERSFKMQREKDIDMLFSDFVEVYKRDMETRIKVSTWLTKISIINLKSLPYFEDKKMNEIRTSDIIDWQNHMMKAKGKSNKLYSNTYLKTVHNQLSAIFNHAVRFYDLKQNPARKAGNMGKGTSREMKIWTRDEYLLFADSMMDKEISFHAFEMLYWCGLRLGEMLALTPNDFDFKAQTVTVNKTYQRLQCKDIITSPKTLKSNRIIKIPDFLCDEIQNYITHIYSIRKNNRIFPVTKSYIEHEMIRGTKEQNLEKIRVHDLRHPPVKLKLKIILISTSSLEKPILTNLCLFYLGDNINKISITYHYSCFQVFSHLGNLIGIASAFWQRYLILQVFHFARYHV